MLVSLFSGEDSESCFLVTMSTWLELGDSREASLIACSESQSKHSTHFTDPTYRTSHIIKIIVTCQGADCSKLYNESATPCSTGDWCLRWRDSITKIHSTIWHSSWGVKSWELMTYFKIVLSYRKKSYSSTLHDLSSLPAPTKRKYKILTWQQPLSCIYCKSQQRALAWPPFLYSYSSPWCK